MKIIVVSDTHGVYFNMKRIVDRHHDASIIVHCGDCRDELERIRDEYPQKKCIAVRGNWDSSSMLKTVEFFDEQGIKFMVTHGHTYHVKDSLDELEKAAREADASVVLFGHTHIVHNEDIDGIKFMNPGSTSEKSFGIIEIINGELNARIEEL